MGQWKENVNKTNGNGDAWGMGYQFEYQRMYQIKNAQNDFQKNMLINQINLFFKAEKASWDRNFS